MTAAQDPSKPTRRDARAVRPTYIHELEGWPNFQWQQEDVTMPLARTSSRLTELVDLILAQGDQAANEATIQNLTDSAVASSRIEAEFPDPNAVRQAIAKRIAAGSQLDIQNEPGIAAVTTDAAQRHDEPLTAERLHQWHRWLFPNAGPKQMTVGDWRDDRLGSMQVVSVSALGRQPIVHFEAPAADRFKAEMNRFLEWFNQPEPDPDLRKAAIAHLWFVTIHPYDDGNGRVARAITDLALSRCDGTNHRLYSMSAEIMRQRDRYYQALQVTQSGSMDITGWMIWFLDCLAEAASHGKQTANAAMSRTKLQAFSQNHNLNERQVKFLDRLVDGWTGNVTTPHYRRMTRCGPEIAEQDVAHLVELGILARNETSGRTVSYRVQQLP